MHHHSIITIQNTSVRLLKQDITKVDKILFLPDSNSDLAKIKFCQIRICQIRAERARNGTILSSKKDGQSGAKVKKPGLFLQNSNPKTKNRRTHTVQFCVF